MNLIDDAAILKSRHGEAMALRGVTASGKVRGLLFELSVEQRYRNPGNANVEAVYTFPLPFEAVLLGLDVHIGERSSTAAVVERKQAEANYEAALEGGDAAIMLERAGDGLCTLNLGNLLAGEEATIRYRYAQLLRFEHGSVRIAVPTVIAPRYGDPAEGGLQVHQSPDVDLRAEYPFDLTVDLYGDVAAGTIASPSHAIATQRRSDGVRVQLPRAASLDRDFILQIDGLEGHAVATLAPDGDGVVVLASFLADLPRDAAEAPLTVKLLVDCSGSMAGDSIAAAKRSLHEILATLGPRDRFSLTRFGGTVRHETRTVSYATDANIRHAARCIGTMTADLGGTEMTRALASVFALGGEREAADVLVITDGEIWNADSLVQAARAAQQRVFAVGIGAAPAEGVLRLLADATGGACEFVAPHEDATGAIVRMFSRLRSPRVCNTTLAWPAKPEWVTPLPSGLFGGETVHVFARFDRAPAGVGELALIDAKGHAVRSSVSLAEVVTGDDTLARVAAWRRLPMLGAPEQLALALEYSLLTDRTNLLVVHERAAGEKAKDLPVLAKVPQMLAAGWGGVGASEVAFCALFADDVQDGFAPRRGLQDVYERKLRDVASHGDFASLIAALEPSGADPALDLPTTLQALRRLGVPDALADLLDELVRSGEAETDVVRSLLTAMSDDASIPMSRQLRRRLARLFASDAECRALRAAVGERLRAWQSGTANALS